MKTKTFPCNSTYIGFIMQIKNIEKFFEYCLNIDFTLFVLDKICVFKALVFFPTPILTLPTQALCLALSIHLSLVLHPISNITKVTQPMFILPSEVIATTMVFAMVKWCILVVNPLCMVEVELVSELDPDIQKQISKKISKLEEHGNQTWTGWTT